MAQAKGKKQPVARLLTRGGEPRRQAYPFGTYALFITLFFFPPSPPLAWPYSLAEWSEKVVNGARTVSAANSAPGTEHLYTVPYTEYTIS